MVGFVEVAVPEEHVMAVYRFLIALDQEPEETTDAVAKIARLGVSGPTGRTAEMIRAQDSAP